MLMQFTAEQEDLRRSLRRFLEQRSPSAEVRRLMETPEGVDPAVWQQLAGQLGVVALGIPESYGGAGGGQVERTVVFEEAGRSLLCAPLLSSVLAVEALLRSRRRRGVCRDAARDRRGDDRRDARAVQADRSVVARRAAGDGDRLG